MKFTHMLMVAAAPLVMAACGAQTPEAAGDTDASLAFGTEYSCSGTDISVGILDDTTMLRADGKEYALLPVETASGAKYAAEGEPETSFWSKGEGGLLVLEGVEYAGCVQTGGYGEPAEAIDPGDLAPAETLTARGNEPGWTLTLDGTTLTYVYAYGESTRTAPQPAPQAYEGGRRYATEDGALVFTVVDTLCADDMSGMPYPKSVTVEFEGSSYRGCGGDTQDLVTGDWEVIEVNGAEVMPGAAITMTFDAADAPEPETPGQFVPGTGRVAGNAGCNSYGAEYTISGEGLSVGDAVRTEMACEPDLMAQEDAFLDALSRVSALIFEAEGAEVELRDHEFRQIYARRK